MHARYSLAIRWMLFISLFYLADCKQTNPSLPPVNTATYRPVYISYATLRTTALMAPQPLKNPGKIYVKDQYLLIGESGSGFHVVDNTDPAEPRKVAFMAIPGNTDFAISGSTLYANNGPDLLVFSFTDPTNMRLLKRLENALTTSGFNYPAARSVRFECPDASRGYIARWEEAPVENPTCYR